MIVRIMADNQYRLTDEQMAEVDRLDNDLEAALNANDNAAFQATLQQLTAYVQQSGEVVPDEEVVASDVIVPAADMSLDEARRHFTPHAVSAQHSQGQTPAE